MKAASSLVRNEIVPTRSSGTSGRLIAWSAATATNSSSILARARARLTHQRSRGAGKTRGDGIHGDAVSGKIACQRSREPDDTALAGDIMRKAGNHRAERTRGHVDHAAPFSRPHAGHERGSDQEGAVEIDG